jgi:hypothetical protein
MKGLNVNGFIIVETLGSGRSGLLYLARHPTTGQEAIIRLAGNAEDGVTAKVFLEEAASLLPALRGVEPSVASDGRSVLIARAEAPTEPLPRPRPGEGRTMYPDTAQIPVARPGSSRRVLPLAMMFIGLSALGAGITVAMLALRAPAPTAEPVAQPAAPTVALTPPPQPTADAAIAAPPAPVAVVPPPLPEPEPPAVAAVRPKPAKPSKPSAAPGRECVADQRWRKAAQSDLGQHRVLAARLGSEPFRRYELAEDAIEARIEALPMDADCAELDAAIDTLLLSVKSTKVVCTPDVLWKRTMQNNLAEVEEKANLMEPVEVAAEVRVIGAAVDRATNQAECEQATRRFDSLLKRAIK